MQGALDAAPMYRSTGHAFTSLARAEGVHGFYRGFGAILLGFAPAQVRSDGLSTAEIVCCLMVGARPAADCPMPIMTLGTSCDRHSFAGHVFRGL